MDSCTCRGITHHHCNTINNVINRPMLHLYWKEKPMCCWMLQCYSNGAPTPKMFQVYSLLVLNQCLTDLDKPKGEVRSCLPPWALMKCHPPVINHSREGTVVLVLVILCIGLTWKCDKPQKFMWVTEYSKPTCDIRSLTLVPEGPFDGHIEQWVDHWIPQNRFFFRSEITTWRKHAQCS